MLDTEAAVNERHLRFIRRVTASNLVWGLRSEEGWAVSPSNDSEDRRVMPFWSDRAYAAQCAKDGWAAYQATPIPLQEFLEEWLPGLANDSFIVGTNWNVHLFGREIDPTKLAEELARAGRENGSTGASGPA